MRLSRLRINHLRSIESLEIEPGEGINILWGSNGSGKTTILEAIHLLHSGKSFRTTRFGDLVARGQQQFGIRGDVSDGPDETGVKVIRVQKGIQHSVVELEGSIVSNASTLAKALPLLLIEPTSFAIVEGAPKVRRSLIDRASFHVEPGFFRDARNYTTALQQRNRLLKSHPKASQLSFWNEELARHGEAIHRCRARCVQVLNENLSNGSPLEERLGRISLRYRRGWLERSTLSEALEDNFPLQLTSGSTLVGPHKAEVEITNSGGSLARIASRGQVKAVIISLVTAMVEYIESTIGAAPILLVDDFAAELDNAMRQLAFNMLEKIRSQVFLTSIEDLAPNFNSSRKLTSFHVEHGGIDSLPFDPNQ